jgi:hypothetical protein
VTRPAKLAAETVFCLHRLQRLETEKPDHAWLWRIRRKILRFVVCRHGLGELAGTCELGESEKSDIMKTNSVLHLPAPSARTFESDEVRKVRVRLRKKLESLETLFRPA